MNSKYVDSVHREGTIWNLSVMVILLLFPVVVGILYHTFPDWQGFLMGLIATNVVTHGNTRDSQGR